MELLRRYRSQVQGYREVVARGRRVSRSIMQCQRIIRASVGTELPRVSWCYLSTSRRSVASQRWALPEGELVVTNIYVIVEVECYNRNLAYWVRGVMWKKILNRKMWKNIRRKCKSARPTFALYVTERMCVLIDGLDFEWTKDTLSNSVEDGGTWTGLPCYTPVASAKHLAFLHRCVSQFVCTNQRNLSERKTENATDAKWLNVNDDKST